MKTAESLAVSACLNRFSSVFEGFQAWIKKTQIQQQTLQQSKSTLSTPEFYANEADFFMDYMMDSQQFANVDFSQSNAQALNTLNSLASSNNAYAKLALFKIHAVNTFLTSDNPIYKCFELSHDPVLGVWHLAIAAITLNAAKKKFKEVIETLIKNPAHDFMLLLTQLSSTRPIPDHCEALTRIINISIEAVNNNHPIPYEKFDSNYKSETNSLGQEVSPGSSPTKPLTLQ